MFLDTDSTGPVLATNSEWVEVNFKEVNVNWTSHSGEVLGLSQTDFIYIFFNQHAFVNNHLHESGKQITHGNSDLYGGAVKRTLTLTSSIPQQLTDVLKSKPLWQASS